MHAGGIVTLTTDFGLRDSYVAQMKGTILSTALRVTIVDVTHGISRHSIVQAAFVIADMMIIDPYPGVVKHGPEADVQPVAEPILAQGKAPMIDPDPRLRAQIRKLGLPHSGNRDGAHFSRRYAVIGHVQKRPFSVKHKSIMCHGSSPVDAVRRRTARRVSRKAN